VELVFLDEPDYGSAGTSLITDLFFPSTTLPQCERTFEIALVASKLCRNQESSVRTGSSAGAARVDIFRSLACRILLTAVIARGVARTRTGT